jgi:hypothetical protein
VDGQQNNHCGMKADLPARTWGAGACRKASVGSLAVGIRRHDD